MSHNLTIHDLTLAQYDRIGIDEEHGRSASWKTLVAGDLTITFFKPVPLWPGVDQVAYADER